MQTKEKKPDKGLSAVFMLFNMLLWGIPSAVMYFFEKSLGQNALSTILLIITPILYSAQLYGLYLIFTDREAFLYEYRSRLIHAPLWFILFAFTFLIILNSIWQGWR